MPTTLTVAMTYNSEIIKNDFVIYRVTDPNLKPYYIGCCPLIQFMALPDFRKNRCFSIHTTYYIGSLYVVQGKAEAIKLHREEVIKAGTPEYNKYGYSMKRGGIVCDQTGEVFATVSEAAIAYSCSQSHLSNHLNHKPGFVSVKGKTFHYQING